MTDAQKAVIERVARAIYEDRNGHGCTPWPIRTKDHKGPYTTDARAALSVLQPGDVLPNGLVVRSGGYAEQQHTAGEKGRLTRKQWGATRT